MKKILLPTLMMLFASIMILILPTEAEAKIYDDTIRLHILAESDSEDDQKLKLSLRDAILGEFGSELSGYESVIDARERLSEKTREIENFSREFILRAGYDYTVRAELVEEWYDTRKYEDFTLPKGYYASLKIIIGKGEGKNWWCVMYPPLCLDFSKSDGYSEAENNLVVGKYAVKFKLLELLSELCK